MNSIDNKYCIDLELDIYPIKEDVLADVEQRPHTELFEHDFTDEIVAFFASQGLRITFAEVFNRYLDSPSTIHSDAKESTDAAKINWIFGGGDSRMNWWKPLVDKANESKTTLNLNYKFYHEHECELLHTQQVGFPSIVQVAIPHNVTMLADHRICISVFLSRINDERTCLPFDELVEILKDYIKK